MSEFVIVKKEEMIEKLSILLDSFFNGKDVTIIVKKLLDEFNNERISIDSKLKIVDLLGIENLALRYSIQNNLNDYDKGYMDALNHILSVFKTNENEK